MYGISGSGCDSDWMSRLVSDNMWFCQRLSLEFLLSACCFDSFLKTINAWQSPAIARLAQRPQAGDVIPLQRSNRRVCWLRDFICNEGVPFRPYRGGVVNAQRVFVPGDLDL